MDGFPSRVIVVKSREMLLYTWVTLVQQLIPPLVSQLIRLRLCLDIVIFLEETRLSYQQGIVLLQGIGGDPCLNRCTAPAVDNNTLRNPMLFLHPLSQESAQGRKLPGILLGQWFPVDGSGTDIVLYPMCVRLVLYPEQADLVICQLVYLFRILRIDTFYRDIHIRLPGAKPHVTYQHIG